MNWDEMKMIVMITKVAKAFQPITDCWSLVLATQLNGLCIFHQRGRHTGLELTFRGGSSSELAKGFRSPPRFKVHPMHLTQN